MIFRVSFLAVATVAAVAVSLKKQNSSIKLKDLEKHGSSLQHIEVEEDGEAQEDEEAKPIRMRQNSLYKRDCGGGNEILRRDNMAKNANYELVLFSSLVQEIEQRKGTLEKKCVKLNELKEKQSYLARLQRNLEEKMAEEDMLNANINFLKAQKNDLQKEIQEGILAENQLQMSKKMIQEMQRNGHQKDQLMMIQEKISDFRSNEEFSQTEFLVEKKVKAAKRLQLELVAIWRRNKELELEKRELALKLVAAQARISRLSNLTESNKIAKAEEELSSLRHANEDLSNQVERLQNNRFGMVEELVYQRWLNACLRMENQNHQILSRMPSKRDKITNINQKPRRKTDKSMLESDFDSFSSHISSTESENDDSTTTIGSSSSSTSEKSGTKKQGKCQEKSSGTNLWSRNGLIRRLSTWMVPSKPSMVCSKNDNSANNTPTRNKQMQDLTESLEKPSVPRRKRVSFSDSVRTDASAFQEMPGSVEEVLLNEEMITTDIKASPESNAAALAREKHEISSSEINVNAEFDCSVDAIELPGARDHVKTKLDKNRIEIAHSEISHSHPWSRNVLSDEENVEVHVLHLIAVVFIFCFILLGYFLVLTAGIY